MVWHHLIEESFQRTKRKLTNRRSQVPTYLSNNVINYNEFVYNNTIPIVFVISFPNLSVV